MSWELRVYPVRPPDRDAVGLQVVRYLVGGESGEIVHQQYLNPDGVWVDYQPFETIELAAVIPVPDLMRSGDPVQRIVAEATKILEAQGVA